jgi:hypothetical protein
MILISSFCVPLARSNQRCCAGKVVSTLNKPLPPFVSEDGEEKKTCQEKEIFQIAKQNNKRRGGVKSRFANAEMIEGNAYATQMNEFF